MSCQCHCFRAMCIHPVNRCDGQTREVHEGFKERNSRAQRVERKAADECEGARSGGERLGSGGMDRKGKEECTKLVV